MAKIINNQISGKFKGGVFRNTRFGLVLSSLPLQVNNPQTPAQMRNRCQMANLGGVYRLCNEEMPYLFELKKPNYSDYNAFVAINHNQSPVYLTKRESLTKACVLSPYRITCGTLTAIGYSVVEPVETNDPSASSGSVLVTDLSLGDLIIDKDTTQADLSEALITNNKDWQEGDLLYFLHGTQAIDPVYGHPIAKMEAHSVAIDTTDYASAQRLYDQVSSWGFSSVDGYLGMCTPLVEGAAAYIHLRHTPNGKILISTQNLYVVSSILATYQSDEAFQRSAESYR